MLALQYPYNLSVIVIAGCQAQIFVGVVTSIGAYHLVSAYYIFTCCYKCMRLLTRFYGNPINHVYFCAVLQVLSLLALANTIRNIEGSLGPLIGVQGDPCPHCHMLGLNCISGTRSFFAWHQRMPDKFH